jgi:hypothetical protein
MTPLEADWHDFMRSFGFTPDIHYGQLSPPLAEPFMLPGFGVLPGFHMLNPDGIPSGTAALSEIGNVGPNEMATVPKIDIPTERANLSKVVAPTERAIPAQVADLIESAAVDVTNPIVESAVVIEGEPSRKKPAKEKHHTLHVCYLSNATELFLNSLDLVVHRQVSHSLVSGSRASPCRA